MYIESNGNTVTISSPNGFDMDGGTIVLSLKQAYALRDALQAMRFTFDIEGVEENGEDG